MKQDFSKLLILFISAVMCLISCKSPVNKQIKEEPDSRWIEEMTIAQLQQGYKEGKYSIAEVVSTYLNRFDKIDRNGPLLNSIIEINPDAMKMIFR